MGSAIARVCVAMLFIMGGGLRLFLGFVTDSTLFAIHAGAPGVLSVGSILAGIALLVVVKWGYRMALGVTLGKMGLYVFEMIAFPRTHLLDWNVSFPLLCWQTFMLLVLIVMYVSQPSATTDATDR